MSISDKLILYTDGSTIVRNPSQYGGTYSFILVQYDNKEILRSSGVYIPKNMGTSTVTNNQMELLAILIGLQSAKEHKLHITKIRSDSKIALGRMFQGWRLKNIPDWMVELKDSFSVGGIRGEFVKGHNGNKWNELADQICEREAVSYLQRSGLAHLIYQHRHPFWQRVNG